MRDITHIVLHCTATPATMDVGVAEIRDWHVNGNGWSDIGYHYVVCRDGMVEDGRPVEKAGAHVSGFNTNSIGVALVGGVTSNGNTSEDNFTSKQMDSAVHFVISLMKTHNVKIGNILGHKEVIETITHGSPKDCPVFSMEDFRVRLMTEFESEKPQPIFIVENRSTAIINIASGLDVYVYAETEEEVKEKANRVIGYLT
jgi:N-acetylmuramoyl-L-alanine amidase